MKPEEHDVLIRVETKIEAVCKRLDGVEKELKKRQCLLHSKQIDILENSFNPVLCSTHDEKIKTIEKLTWGAVLMALGLIGKSLWSAIST